MTPKADKAQLRKIAEELVGPLLAAQAREHQEIVQKAVRAAQEATEALAAERARVSTWRNRIEAESKDMHAMIRAFRSELDVLTAASDARDATQDRAMDVLDQRLAEVDRRLSELLGERDAVDDLKRQTLSEWLKLDAELKHTKAIGEEALKAKGKAEQEAIAAAGKHAVDVATNVRSEFERAESSIKSVARGVLRKMEQANG